MPLHIPQVPHYPDNATTLEELSPKFVKTAWRKRIHQLTHYSCLYCGKVPSESLDHLVPEALGGHTTLNNLIPSCLKCNYSKGSKDFQDWYSKQPFYNPRREEAVLAWMNGNQTLATELSLEYVNKMEKASLDEALRIWEENKRFRFARKKEPKTDS